MSSGNAANRAPRGGDGADYFATPAWCVRAVLPYLRAGMPGEDGWQWWLSQARILEPSAGDGAIVRVLIEAGAQPWGITAVEPSEDRVGKIHESALTFACSLEEYVKIDTGVRFDLIVMNPPYSLAESHIRLACSLLAPGGTCAALVRLAFLAEGQCRAGFRNAHPHDRLELVRRPSFTAERVASMTDDDLFAAAKESERHYDFDGDGRPIDIAKDRTIAAVRARLMRTDSAAYAWGLFGEGRGGRFWTHEEEA